LLLFGSGWPHREPVEIGHANALDALDNNWLANAAELFRDAGELRDPGISRTIGIEGTERIFFRLPAALPTWPVESHGYGDGLLPAQLHHQDRKSTRL